MYIYLVNGRTPEVGQWIPEAFYKYEDAEKCFENYLSEYEDYVEIDDDFYRRAVTIEDYSFWIESVKVK